MGTESIQPTGGSSRGRTGEGGSGRCSELGEKGVRFGRDC